jgi:hypothetical protein
MVDDTVQTSWKRFTDQVKGWWSDHSDDRGNELPPKIEQQHPASGALPQSTTQTPQADAGPPPEQLVSHRPVESAHDCRISKAGSPVQ